MLDKALGIPADELVIDLEDAVAAAAKDSARALVAGRLEGLARGRAHVSVRVNAIGTRWCHQDLIALAGCPRPPDSIVVPKVEGGGDLAFVERLLDGALAERGGPVRVGVQALVETARGLEQIGQIAAAGGRLDALVLGYADLAASLGRAAGAGDPAWDPARDAVLVAARSRGLRAIDGPYLGTAVDDGFLAAARRASAVGFDGKWAIHPAQVESLNDAFTPTAADVERASAVLAALAAAEAGGAGAVELDGRMVDEAVRVAALRVLARAGLAGAGSPAPPA
jgi:citrate lyase subunit beta/citryl-CoA lyase